MKRSILIGLTVVLGLLSPTLAAEERKVKDRSIEGIDTPTADTVNHYGYFVSFRFGQNGNLQTKTSYGIFPRLNLGFGLDGERFIGSDNARLNTPSINGKLRFFDGKKGLPALAMGFDGQGYVWNKTRDHYEQRELGFYLVGTGEVFKPGLILSLGVNNFDFNSGNATRAFGSLSYLYENILGMLLEYTNATEYKERRINFGFKYYLTPVFTVEALGRNIPKSFGSYNRETERVVRLAYTGAF